MLADSFAVFFIFYEFLQKKINLAILLKIFRIPVDHSFYSKIFRNVIDINVDDQGDDYRKAISQAGSDGSVVTFPAGFEASYAIAINQFGSGLFSIPATGAVVTGPNELGFLGAVGNPASNTQASFSFTFDWSNIGLTDKDEFDFVITYLNSSNGFSSDEGYGNGIPTPNPGTNDFTFTSSESYPDYFYTFDGTTWSPSDPDGVTEPCRRALILSGTDTFSSQTTLDAVRINPQGVLDLDANLSADLIFKSDANGSGQLADATGNIVSGKARVERFIPAGPPELRRAYRLLTSAVNSTGSINANWQEGAVTTALGNGNPNSGFGTHITGGTVADGFDQNGTGNPSMFTFDNSNSNGNTQSDDWSSLPILT
jgi:hypothetical protein